MAPIDDATLLAELDGDPAGLGYKDGTGALKATAELGRLLTAPGPAVANPAPRPGVPVAITRAAAIALISGVSLSKVLARPAAEALLGLLDLPDPKGPATVGRLVADAAALFKAGDLQQAEYDALAAPAPGTGAGAATGLYNQTEPDPSWPATVPGPARLEALGFAGAIDGGQINRVLGR